MDLFLCDSDQNTAWHNQFSILLHMLKLTVRTQTFFFQKRTPHFLTYSSSINTGLQKVIFLNGQIKPLMHTAFMFLKDT